MRRIIIVTIFTAVLVGCSVSATTLTPPLLTATTNEPTSTNPPTLTHTPTVTPASTLVPSPTLTPLPDPFANVDPSGQSIIFWHNHLYERRSALRRIVSEFNAGNPYNITVTEQFRGGTDDLFSRYLNAEEPPNLIVSYQNQAATYFAEELIVDLTPLMSSQTWGISSDDYFAAFLAGDRFPQYEDAHLGLAVNRSMEVVYYNVDWLDQLRQQGAISFTGPPQTPEQFQEAACAAAVSPFREGTASTGYASSPGASSLASWTFAFGGTVFDAGRYTYDGPAAITAMTFLQELHTADCARVVTARYADQDAFGAGTALFTVSTSSGIPFYDQAVSNRVPFAWSTAALPHVMPQPAQNLYGPSVSITNASPEAVLASWLFLRHYTQPAPQAEWAQASGYFPVRRSAAEDMQPFMAENPPYAAAFELLPYGTSEPTDARYNEVRPLAAAAMRDILNGADVTTTLQTLTQQANATLQE